MSSESLKLSGILDGNHGNDAAVNCGDAVVYIKIVDVFSNETLEIVSFFDSPSACLSLKTGEKKLAASVRVKT